MGILTGNGETISKAIINSSGNTVMVHIRRLRMKIEDDPQKPKMIQTVWGKGYRLG